LDAQASGICQAVFARFFGRLLGDELTNLDLDDESRDDPRRRARLSSS